MEENNVIVSDFVNREEIKRRVNQLLQEIDREIENNKPDNDWEWSEYVEGLKFAKDLVKKAFRGLIE